MVAAGPPVCLLDTESQFLDANSGWLRDHRRAVPTTSWMEVIFNPSFPYRLTHMLLASALTASFLIAGLSAWQLLRAPPMAAPGARCTRP